MGQVELTEVGGFLWPASDRHFRAVVFDTVVDMLPALDLTPGREWAIQAGGNCGVWAAWLAKRFDRVVTVEPDMVNYHCLVQNVPDNVSHERAAFGENYGRMGMAADPANVGAHYLKGTGTVPVIPIDGMNLPGCDYLCLDVEGYELPALMGAEDTIRRFRPVIQIEDKGLSEKYGHRQGDAEKWLARFGYEVRHRIHRDVICAPA